MVNTTARLTKNGKHFEVLVDLEEALKFRKGEPGASLSAAVLTDAVFSNLKAGDRANRDVLESVFGTSDLMEVSEKIIKNGEIVLPTDYLRAEHEKKYRQVVDRLSGMAVSPDGIPISPDRIMKALSEAHVNIKNKPIDEQIPEIVDKLSKILPMKIEFRRAKLLIPAQHTGRAYSVIKEYLKKEEWKENGSLVAEVEVPAAMIFDFYERLNKATGGSVLSEEIK